MKKLTFIFLILLTITLSGCNQSSKDLTIDIDSQANPWTHLRFNNNPDNFQFAIVADRTGGARPGVFECAVDRLNLLQPEFVMCVGDLIEGKAKATEQNRQWDQFDQFVEKLQMPFFYIPGNRDISDETTVRIWRERFGRLYYHFVYRNVLFIGLNASYFLDDEQIDHFKDVLQEHGDVRWTLVFMHQPLAASSPLKRDKNGWNKFSKLLGNRKNTVFAGHWHTYQKYEYSEQDYYRLATTGGGSTLDGPLYGRFDHIVWVTMTDDGPLMANLMLDGIYDDDPASYREFDN